MLFKRKQIPFPIPGDARELTEEEMILVYGGGKEQSGQQDNSGETQTVKTGDTLSQIVADYNKEHGTDLTVADVAKMSGISNPDLIYPGQKINFGMSNSTSSTPTSSNISNSNCSSGLSGTYTSSSASSSSASTTNTGNDCSTNTIKGQNHHSAYDQQFINEMMEKEQKIALGSNGVSGNKDESASASAVSFDFKNNGYPDYVDSTNGIVYADKCSRKSMEEACAAYSVLCYKGYTFKVTDGAKVTDTFKSESAAKKYVNDLYPAKGNLSEMLGNVSTNTGIANVTADKIIDYADDAARFTKLAKYSGGASKVSFITGGMATGIDLKRAAENPTFENISTLASDVVGFIPEIGPFASVGVSYASEKMEDAAQAGIQIASNEMQFDYTIDSMVGNNSSMIFGDGMNPKYIVKSSFLQGLSWFFGKE